MCVVCHQSQGEVHDWASFPFAPFILSRVTAVMSCVNERDYNCHQQLIADSTSGASHCLGPVGKSSPTTCSVAPRCFKMMHALAYIT